MSTLADYKKFWSRKFKEDEKAKKKKIKLFKQLASDAANILIKDFKAKKVYLFGSTLDEKIFHEKSDIDLAVEGLNPKIHFSALSEIKKLLFKKANVDLVPMEDASEALKALIFKKGEILYG